MKKNVFVCLLEMGRGETKKWICFIWARLWTGCVHMIFITKKNLYTDTVKAANIFWKLDIVLGLTAFFSHPSFSPSPPFSRQETQAGLGLVTLNQNYTQSTRARASGRNRAGRAQAGPEGLGTVMNDSSMELTYEVVETCGAGKLGVRFQIERLNEKIKKFPSETKFRNIIIWWQLHIAVFPR